jgi:hypothetical protein
MKITYIISNTIEIWPKWPETIRTKPVLKVWYLVRSSCSGALSESADMPTPYGLFLANGVAGTADCATGMG